MKLLPNKIFKIVFLATTISLFSCAKAKNYITAVNSVTIDSVKIWSHPNNRFQLNNNKNLLSIYFDHNESRNQVVVEWFLALNKLEEVTSVKTVVNLENDSDTKVKVSTKHNEVDFFIRPHIVSNESFKQEQFVISTFSAVPYTINESYRKILTNTKKANLSHIETAFVSPEGSVEVLKQAEQLGLKVIVQDFTRFGGFQNSQSHISNSTDESMFDAIQRYSKYGSFYGYYLWDEPFFEQFTQARKDLDFLKENDPNKLYLIATLQSYSPDYTWENNIYPQYIEDLLDKVRPNILCTNYYYYANDYIRGIGLNESYLWKDWGFIRKKAIESNLPFWFYIQLMGDILNNNLGNITTSQVAVQNFMALAFGVKGISYYNTIYGIIDEFGNPTRLFDDISKLNIETMNIGNALISATTDKLYFSGKLKHSDFLDSISSSKFVKDVTTTVLVGEFFQKDSNERMLMIVNTDFVNRNSGTLSFIKKQKVDFFDSLNNTKVPLGNLDSYSYDLEPGYGVLIYIN